MTDLTLPAYWDRPNPLHYSDAWPLFLLPTPAQNSLKRALLQIHAAFLDGSGGDYPEVECWRRAFNAIASAFDTAGLLTEERLTSTIPAIVADAGASGRWKWGRNSLQKQDPDFSERLGSEYYQPWFVKKYFFLHIEGRLTYWRAHLLTVHSYQIAGERPHRTEANAAANGELGNAATPKSDADFLPEIFDRFDDEERSRVRAAEEAVGEILTRGRAEAEARRLASRTRDQNEWVLAPEEDARADSAAVVFTAYVNALWRQTDLTHDEWINDFLTEVDRLVQPVLERYGWVGQPLIAELYQMCRRNTELVRSMLPIVPASSSDPAVGGLGDSILPESYTGRLLDRDRPILSAKPTEILGFTDSWMQRKRRNAQCEAVYARYSGRNGSEAARQEELLKDGRAWAQSEVIESASKASDIFELRELVVKKSWDEFCPKHQYRGDFRLGYRAFSSALWEEGWPSLEDLAIPIFLERTKRAIANVVSLDSPQVPFVPDSPQPHPKDVEQIGDPLRPPKTGQINVDKINKWMEGEGWTNETLATKLRTSPRTISSMRNNRPYHGADALTKLANLMGVDLADLYLPPEPPA